MARGEPHGAISCISCQIGVFAILESRQRNDCALRRRLGEGNLEGARNTALAAMGFLTCSVDMDTIPLPIHLEHLFQDAWRI